MERTACSTYAQAIDLQVQKAAEKGEVNGQAQQWSAGFHTP